MPDTPCTPTHVHLIGSIGLGGIDKMSRTVGRALGQRFNRIPPTAGRGRAACG